MLFGDWSIANRRILGDFSPTTTPTLCTCSGIEDKAAWTLLFTSIFALSGSVPTSKYTLIDKFPLSSAKEFI